MFYMKALRLFCPQGKCHVLRKMVETYKLTDRLQHISDCPQELQLSSYLLRYETESSMKHAMLVHKKHRTVDMKLLKKYFGKEPGSITKLSQEMAQDFFDQPSQAGDVAPIGVRPNKILLDCELFLKPREEVFCYVGNQPHRLAVSPMELLKFCYGSEIAVFAEGTLPLLDATHIENRY